MKPAKFEYSRPEDLSAVLALLAETEDARILAGGQSLVPMMNFRIAQPVALIDINRVPELGYIRKVGDTIAIGALARHADIQRSPVINTHFPLIAEAYEWVAHAAVRNRGTLCGNLCHADPASEMPALMQLLEAQMVVARKDGQREIPATEFFTGTYETALETGEMLTEVRIPLPAPGTGWGFEEVSMRKGDFAWSACAATLRIENGKISAPRVAVSGVGDAAVRLSTVEEELEGKTPSTALFEAAAQTAVSAIDPHETPAASAAYRKDLVRSLLPRVLDAAIARAT